MASVFWYSERVLLLECLHNHRTINAICFETAEQFMLVMTDEYNSKLQSVKAEIISVVLSSSRSLTLKEFLRDYETSIGRPLPYTSFNFNTASAFLKSLQDVLIIRDRYLVPVQSEKSSHINKMVTEQKNARRGAGLLPSPVGQVSSNNARPVAGPSRLASPRGCDFPYQIPQNIPNVSELERKCDAFRGPTTSSVNEPVLRDQGTSNLNSNQEVGHLGSSLIQNFKTLLAENPSGIQASKFCTIYENKFGFPLSLVDLNYNSIRELVASNSNVFSYEVDEHDWILFAAKNKRSSKGKGFHWIPNLVIDNMAILCNEYPAGIALDELLFIYARFFNSNIDLKKLGFDNVELFVKCCPSLEIKCKAGRSYIYSKPWVLSKVIHSEEETKNRPIPPLSEMGYLWSQYFNENDCTPTTTYTPFQLPAVDELKVKVVDIFSPHEIYCHLSDSRKDLNELMFRLNNFYDENEEDYMLNENAALPNLVCAVRFSVDSRWHRAIITSITSASTVKILFVDYGTTADAHNNELRKLNVEFIKEPIYCILVNLAHIDPVNDKWSAECRHYLVTQWYSKTYFATILERHPEIPSLDVDLVDTITSVDADLSLSCYLVISGFANFNDKIRASFFEGSYYPLQTNLPYDKAQEKVKSLLQCLPYWMTGDLEKSNSEALKNMYYCLSELSNPIDDDASPDDLTIMDFFLADPPGTITVWLETIKKYATPINTDFQNNLRKNFGYLKTKVKSKVPDDSEVPVQMSPPSSSRQSFPPQTSTVPPGLAKSHTPAPTSPPALVKPLPKRHLSPPRTPQASPTTSARPVPSQSTSSSPIDQQFWRPPRVSLATDEHVLEPSSTVTTAHRPTSLNVGNETTPREFIPKKKTSCVSSSESVVTTSKRLECRAYTFKFMDNDLTIILYRNDFYLREKELFEIFCQKVTRVLLQHRIKTLSYETANRFVADRKTFPSIYKCLAEIGLKMDEPSPSLIAARDASKLLRHINPQISESVTNGFNELYKDLTKLR